MNMKLRIIAPLAVLAICIVVAFLLIKTAPEAKRRSPRPVVPVVEVIEVSPVDYQIRVESQGNVMPHTQSTLVSEVAGRIIGVAPNFRNGGFFLKDERLVEIDPAEYRLAAANSEAALAGVKARLAELEIKAQNLIKSQIIETQHLELAERQFRRHSKLREQGTVAQSVLEQSEREYLLRKASLQDLENNLQLIPAQRKLLQSELKLQQAQLDTARLNLARTRIGAPYAGRVLEKQVDIGQSVSKGTVLAAIYAIDYVEVRLPITDRQAGFLTLPNGQQEEKSHGLPVILKAAGDRRHQWQGTILRSEGSIDSRTRQQFLIAQISDPYSASADGRQPLKIGQFVEAEIPGQILEDVFILPREAVRADDEVLVITRDERIERRRLEVVWGDKQQVVVRSGLSAGERVSLTALPYAADGAQIRVGDSKPRKTASTGVK